MFSSSFAIKLVRVTFWSFYVSMLAVDQSHVDDTAENFTAVLSGLARL